MKEILVTCALIESEGKFLLAQRGPEMSHPGKWEFPGGKLETGEAPEECIVREIREELSLEIEVVRRLSDHAHVYPELQRRVILMPFLCRMVGGGLVLQEHAAVAWVAGPEMTGYDLVEADVEIASWFTELDQKA